MARKAKNIKRGRPKKNEHKENDSLGLLNSETKHGIYVVVLWLLGLISLLSLVNLAGAFGRFWSMGLTRLFGWGDFLIALIFIVLGYLLFKKEKFNISSINYWGLGLGVLSFYALLHWTQGSDKLISSISTGRGGGYVGLILSWPLIKFFGLIAGFVVLLALFIVALLLLFETSIERLLGEHNPLRRGYLYVRHLFLSRKYNGNEEDYADDTEEAEEEIDEDEGIEDEAHPIEPGEEPSDHESRQEELIKVPKRIMPKIELPVELLSGKSSKPNSGDIRQNQQIIQKTLANFGIPVEMAEVNVGPTVTQYTLRPAEGVKVSQIYSLQNDISLALAAHPIRIEAPIPGKSLVGIEVPNQSVAIVTLKEILTSDKFQKARPSHLTITLGKDVAGDPYLADLDKMPHLLIAGATGSGKSIAINSLIISLMYQNQPSDLKFILVDPKRVELTTYKDIPYLLTPVITDVKKTINSLRWAVSEMDRRYNLLSQSGNRKLSTYNKEAALEDKLPYIIIVIDELADLMSVAAADIEGAIVRLAQMARAVGIHLVVATQRPSVNVITGLIKANITARVAFSVASLVDSRTILDNSGAEKLLGRGDMLFISAELAKPKRIQGAFVSDKDIDSVASFLRKKARPDYTDVATQISTATLGSSARGYEDTDELLEDAKEVILRADKASASLLQRRLRVGYARAARILDILEEEGFIGPAEGAKPREVLVSQTDYQPEADEPLAHEEKIEEDNDEDDGYEETEDEAENEREDLEEVEDEAEDDEYEEEENK